MKTWALILLCAWLGACATPPDRPADARFFADPLFAPPSTPVRVDEVFALSPAMTRYLEVDIADKLRSRGRQQALLDALYAKGELKLEYDSTMTRNAAQAFEARSGNCLSLAIMTAAFAKALNVPVRFQSVVTDDTWARSGNLHFVIDHINLSLGKQLTEMQRGAGFQEVLTVDFLPSQDLRHQRTRVLTERTVLAMYMNNRAAETLARGRIDDAYWWAREAVVQDPGFTRAYNTLGVVYRRHGDLREAEQALAYALDQEPTNPQIVANLAQVMADQGRSAEAAAYRVRLSQLEAEPPYSQYERGLAALRAGDPVAARQLFERALARSPGNHEFLYGLALAYARMGDPQEAARHLSLAMQSSTSRSEHDLYAAKLDRLQSSLAH